MNPFWELLLKIGLMVVFVGAAFYLRVFEMRRRQEKDLEIARIMKENNKRLRLEKLNNPFAVLFDEQKSSLKNGVYFKIKANVESFFMIMAWAVKIDKMYEELDSRTVKQCFYENGDEPRRLFEESSIQWRREHLVNYESSLDDREFHYTVPAQCLEKFQDQERLNRPRDVYQLVIMIYRDPADLALMKPTDIATSLWVYHFKDNDRLNTKLLHYYSKRLNNELIYVNKIFDQNELCVVCQTESSNQLVLPCAHKCLCTDCLPRCQDKCPVCRLKIGFSFKLD